MKLNAGISSEDFAREGIVPGTEIVFDIDEERQINAWVESLEYGPDLLFDGDELAEILEVYGEEITSEFLKNVEIFARENGLQNISLDASLDETDNLNMFLSANGYNRTNWRYFTANPARITEELEQNLPLPESGIVGPVIFPLHTVDEKSAAAFPYDAADILVEALGPESKSKEPWTKETALAYLIRTIEESDTAFVAFLNGELVGFILADLESNFAHIACVKENLHQKGTGTRLLYLVFSESAKNGSEVINFSGNITMPSFSWYERLGAEQIDRADWIKHL